MAHNLIANYGLTKHMQTFVRHVQTKAASPGSDLTYLSLFVVLAPASGGVG